MSNHIPKRHQITWKEYANDLIHSSRKFAYIIHNEPRHSCMTDIERHELAGYLLRDDIGLNPSDVGHNLVEILERDDHYFADLLATYCISDSPENGDRLLDHLRKVVAEHYQEKMQLILNEREVEHE